MDRTSPTTSPRRPGHRSVQVGGVALRVNARVLAYAGVLSLGLLALMIWAMMLGSYRLDAGDVASAVIGRGDAQDVLIVRDVRLPRVLSAVLVGAALAVAGGLFQGLLRSPLVSPDLVGIDNGAGVVAVFWIVTGMPLGALPIAAFIGAFTGAAVIYGLSWRRGIDPNRLILIGIGVGSLLEAGTTFLTIRYPIERARPAIVWLIGSMYGCDWADVQVLTGFVAIGTLGAIVLSPGLRAIQLGDDVARGLGLPLEGTRLGLLAIAAGFVAVSVAVAGPIGFVALMVPHAARSIAGPLSASSILLSAVLGGCLLLVADMAGQHLLPIALPVGIVTAAIGAPYFLVLIYRANAQL